MTFEEKVKVCQVCTNRAMDLKVGLVCSLTKAKPAWEEKCPDFSMDQREYDNRQQFAQELEASESGSSYGGGFGLERKGMDKGVVGGVVMMLIAVIWFVIGWQAGYIYFYPPVLFIFGVVALVKGLATGNFAGKK